MTSVISIVVHPSRIFREGLTSILAKTPFAPACSASSTEDVPSTIADAGEQVLVLIGVKEGSNLGEALRAAKSNFPDAHLVVIGDANKRDIVATAIALGATSFVDENLATTNLVKELELVAQNEPVISVLILKRLLGHWRAPPSEEPVGSKELVAIRSTEESPSPGTQEEAEPGPHLSQREAAILHALTHGTPNKIIANQLKISEATVKVHVKAILRKIRVKNRTQAAIWAQNRQAETKNLELVID
jgi:two-component system, NarL family, nitrate/nitrite response regulator NarL